MLEMKERERWRPEEDCLLRTYVKKYGAGEWNLVSQRMSKVLDRDAKSCQERWKNYLKPGIKKGSLSEEEQLLVVSLQAKYGNKWKKIASQMPGRTAKRLSKWWEAYKEKEKKKDCTEETPIHSANLIGSEGNNYHHILETFAEKYMQNQNQFISPTNYSSPSITVAMPPPSLSLNFPTNTIPIPDFFHMPTPNTVGLTFDRPPWMSSGKKSSVSSSYTSSEYSASRSYSSPSVTLSLYPSLSSHVASAPKNTVNEIAEGSAREKILIHVDDLAPKRQAASTASESVIMQQITTFFEQCKELEERQQLWLKHKKDACWRLKRLQEQLESEKARKRRVKNEEIESKVWALREEEKMYLDRVEKDYRDQMARLHKDEELKEARMMEMWTAQHDQLTKFFQQMIHRH